MRMKLSDWLLVGLLSMIWGSAFLFIKMGLADLSPYLLVFSRVLLGALLLLAVCLARRIPLPQGRAQWQSLAFLGVINCTIPFVLVAWAQQHLTTGTASILNATTPVFVMVLAHFLTEDEKLTTPRLVGVLLGFLGIIVMMWPSLKDGFQLRGWGQLAMLGATFHYSLSGIYAKRFKGISSVWVSAVSLLAAAALLLPVVLYTGVPSLSAIRGQTFFAVAMLGVFCTGIAFMLYYRLLQDVGATNVLLVTLLIPVSALFISAFFLHERIELTDWAGMACIFSGLLVIDGRVFGSNTPQAQPHTAG